MAAAEMPSIDLGYIAPRRARVDEALASALEACGAPEPLFSAMKYAVLGEGKRLRPILTIAAAHAVSGRPESIDAALPFACAVELIHAYSLVHDDLPAMDDDDLRRGRPTVHKAFDDATAILAGDALQSLAFALTAGAPSKGRRRALAVAALAKGAGSMVDGQMLDLVAEGRFKSVSPRRDVGALETLASKKTGALISAAAEMGAIAGGAGPKTRAALAAYGRAVGLAFQIADDLLDATGSTADVGKKTGKDTARGKNTFPAQLGLAGAKKRAEALVTEATRIANRFDNEGGQALAGIAEWAVRRTR